MCAADWCGQLSWGAQRYRGTHTKVVQVSGSSFWNLFSTKPLCCTKLLFKALIHYKNLLGTDTKQLTSYHKFRLQTLVI